MKIRIWMTAIVLLMTAVCFSAEPMQAPLSITPDAGSENPVAVGQLVTLRVEGLKDPALGRASVWPEADLLPVLVAPPSATVWRVWGTSPALQFRAATAAHHRVLVLEDADGPDNLAEYTVEVGEPLPPPVLVVEPTTPFLVAGPVGGPFEPLFCRYTVQASRSDWSASVGDVGWLTLERGSTYVRLSVSPAADDLEEGTYEASLIVSLEDLQETRAVTLTVGGEPPPPPPPPPGRKQLAFWVTPGLLDNLPPEQNEMVNGLAFREELNAAGNRFLQVWSDEDEYDNDEERIWFDAAQKSKLKPPLVLMAPMTGGAVDVKPLPKTKAEVWTLLGGKP